VNIIAVTLGCSILIIFLGVLDLEYDVLYILRD